MAVLVAMMPCDNVAKAAFVDYDSFRNDIDECFIGPFATPTYVLTPNGSQVSAYYDSTYILRPFYTWLDADIEEEYPEAIKLRSANVKYNCHSYAWYSQDENNLIWINDPSAYYTDGSYYEVQNPNIGDRICYFNSSNENIHSGIVVNVLSGQSNNVCGNANLVEVDSKWGIYGLYRHYGDECPYVENGTESAVTVKYYRRHEMCDYTYISSSANGLEHVSSCFCGQSVTESHAFSYSSITDTTHKQTCAVCGYNTVVPHLWRVINKSVTGHVKQCNCGHTVDEAHTWVQNALGGYMCSVCRQTGNFAPGIQSLLTPTGRLVLQAANLQHGQVILIDGLPIIYFNGQYYLITDSVTDTPAPVPPVVEMK